MRQWERLKYLQNQNNTLEETVLQNSEEMEQMKVLILRLKKENLIQKSKMMDISKDADAEILSLKQKLSKYSSEWSEHRVYGKHCRLTFLFLLPPSNLWYSLCYVSPLSKISKQVIF